MNRISLPQRADTVWEVRDTTGNRFNYSGQKGTEYRDTMGKGRGVRLPEYSCSGLKGLHSPR